MKLLEAGIWSWYKMSVDTKFQATQDERETAVYRLKEWMDFDNNKRSCCLFLRSMLDDLFQGIEFMYAGILSGKHPEYAKLADEKLPQLIVDMLQTDLLAHKPLRELLLQRLYETDRMNSLFLIKHDEDENMDENLFSESRYEVEDLVKRKWNPGGGWATKFANAFGFPEIFAGIRSLPEPLPYENVKVPIQLNDLEDFQVNIKSKIMSLLKERNGLKNRGIMRLPTGAGKTRVMVEALVELWMNKSSDLKYILWIGQTEEICEQAFQSFRQVWTSKGPPGQTLKIFRYWGNGRRLPTLGEEGVIIAGISKLYSDLKGADSESVESELSSLSKHVAVVVVDEAHRSITPMYNNLFRTLGIKSPSPDSDQIPLIGLTATPYRGYNEDETERLLKKYNNNLVCPTGNRFDIERWCDWTSMKKILTARGILSVPKRKIIFTDRKYVADTGDILQFGNMKSYHKNFLKKLAEDYERNTIIYSALIEMSEIKKSILYFAASVNNANLMSALLREKGIISAVISSNTSSGARQSYIDQFKEGKIQVLSNYGVLSTGFDAPKIDGIIIGRPTESPNLYEQMIGRGLRGPEFGGTKECLIMDLIDNIEFHGDRLPDGSEDYWKEINSSD
jgi:superfamily II DNA or RNA helicase